MMRKTIATVGTSAALIVAGAGTAWAATSGSMNIAADAIRYVGHYNYDCHLSGVPSYKTGVCTNGTLNSSAGETGHLNMKTEGYSWTRIGQAKVNGNVSINRGVYDPQATRVNTMALQVCHERTAIPDKCGTYNYNR